MPFGGSLLTLTQPKVAVLKFALVIAELQVTCTVHSSNNPSDGIVYSAADFNMGPF